jgi:Skp family chaperone for outer membrane proteins
MAESLTFEKVWAMFQETDRKMQETDRKIQETSEQMKETDRKMQETDRQMKETDRKIGQLGNRFGELVEHLVAPNIAEKFNELGFSYEQISKNLVIKDSKRNCIGELDLLLENGEILMAVSVKAKPLERHVDEHVTLIELLRSRADARNDKRKFQGAIAGAIMNDSVRNYILKAGLYVIEQTGDTVKITIPEGFKPREWL